MSIEEEIAQVRALLDRLNSYEYMIDANNFEPDTVDDMKDNAKDLCDELKTIADSIKTEIDNWG